MSNLESVNVTLELHKSSTVDFSTHLQYTLKNINTINWVTDSFFFFFKQLSSYVLTVSASESDGVLHQLKSVQSLQLSVTYHLHTW